MPICNQTSLQRASKPKVALQNTSSMWSSCLANAKWPWCPGWIRSWPSRPATAGRPPPIHAPWHGNGEEPPKWIKMYRNMGVDIWWWWWRWWWWWLLLLCYCALLLFILFLWCDHYVCDWLCLCRFEMSCHMDRCWAHFSLRLVVAVIEVQKGSNWSPFWKLVWNPHNLIKKMSVRLDFDFVEWFWG